MRETSFPGGVVTEWRGEGGLLENKQNKVKKRETEDAGGKAISAACS